MSQALTRHPRTQLVQTIRMSSLQYHRAVGSLSGCLSRLERDLRVWAVWAAQGRYLNGALQRQPGPRLQILPLHILQDISKRFSAVEWACGPAQTCRLLSGMHLPRIALDPLERVAYPTEPETCDLAKAIVTTKIIAALEWTAKRVGQSTTSLNMEFQSLSRLPSSRADNPLIAAFLNASGLDTLRSLRLVTFEINHAAAATYCDWLLEQLASLEALQLLAPSTQLAAGTITLRNLKFLRLAAHSITGSCLKLAGMMPVLEVLSILGAVQFEIVTAGCKRLRLFTIQGSLHHHVPIELHSCRASIDMGLGTFGRPAFEEPSSIQMVSVLRSAAHVGLCCSEYFASEAAGGFFGECQAMEVLTVEWASTATTATGVSAVQQPDAHVFQHLLTKCMPAQGRPLSTLRTIVIGTDKAYYVKIKIPAMLPALEELVVYTRGPLDLAFEDPVATSLSLKTFFCFGEPLIAIGVDVLRMSCALLKRGLTLSAVRAPQECSGERFGSRSSCIYLRPVMAEDSPLRRLHDIAEKLALQCRCGGCFGCLRNAGFVDACVARPPEATAAIGTA